jgi:hypothetical protein
METTPKERKIYSFTMYTKLLFLESPVTLLYIVDLLSDEWEVYAFISLSQYGTREVNTEPGNSDMEARVWQLSLSVRLL